MRDFPVFTTENGVGSITLKEVPYKGIAYIKIQSSQQPCEFLEECVDFCISAGADRIYDMKNVWISAYRQGRIEFMPPVTQCWKNILCIPLFCRCLFFVSFCRNVTAHCFLLRRTRKKCGAGFITRKCVLLIILLQ